MTSIKCVDSGSNWEFLVEIRLQIHFNNILDTMFLFLAGIWDWGVLSLWMPSQLPELRSSQGSALSSSCLHFLSLGAAVSLTHVQRVSLCSLVYTPSRVHASPKSSFVSLGRETIPSAALHRFCFSVTFLGCLENHLPYTLGPLSPS